MNTTEQAKRNSNIPASLIDAVVEQIGEAERLEDVYHHGADGGLTGFTYYSETLPFFNANQKDIVALVESMAEEMGQNPIEFVQSFRCLNADKGEYIPSISRCLYAKPTDEDVDVANAVAWFALEEVARAFID